MRQYQTTLHPQCSFWDLWKALTPDMFSIFTSAIPFFSHRFLTTFPTTFPTALPTSPSDLLLTASHCSLKHSLNSWLHLS